MSKFTDDMKAAKSQDTLSLGEGKGLEINKVHLGDCQVLSKQLKDESLDCCITSPPYFGLREYGSGDAEMGREKSWQEFISALTSLFTTIKDKMKKTGSLWVNIADSYNSTGPKDNKKYFEKNPDKATHQLKIVRRAHADDMVSKAKMGIPYRLRLALNDAGWISRQDIVWRKPAANAFTGKDRFRCEHEYMFHFVKAMPYYFDQTVGRSREFSDWQGGQDTLIGDVWDIPQESLKEHVASYPERLVQIPLLASCPTDGIVLDPFMGSGTTGRVARKHGRNFVGFELNPEYKELSDHRIDEGEMLPGLEMF